MTTPPNNHDSTPRTRRPAFDPVLFGNYILIDHIAKGGMADLYLAKNASTVEFQKPVVIKRLFPHYSSNPRFVHRFLHEATALTQLNCSNIVQLIDMGRFEDEHYIAMEYIEGRSAAHLLSKFKKTGEILPLEVALHVVIEVAKGLGYAHRKKDPEGHDLMLVHQDINTFNVMVSYEAEVKIIDFGIARMLRDSTDNQLVVPMTGKLLYFAPEQLEGKQIDRRVDIYATGELLFEMVTGDRLVEHQETVGDTLKMILNLNIEQKLDEYDTIDPNLKPIMAKAMARDPRHRYSRLEDMADDLVRFIQRKQLEIVPWELAEYLKETFVRERLADDFRIRKLLGANVPLPGGASKSFPIETEQHRPTITVRLPVEEFVSMSTEQTLEKGHSLHPGFCPVDVCFPAGEAIVKQGEPASCLYVIQNGKVRIFQRFGAQEQTLAILRAGEFFGESALLDDQVHVSSATAMENCHLILVRKESVTGLGSRELMGSMIAGLVSKLRDTRAILLGHLLNDPLSKLVYALITFSRRVGLQDGQSIDLDELIALFGLEESDRIKKYVEKLEEIKIVHAVESALQVQDTDRLENILSVLSKSGKLILRV